MKVSIVISGPQEADKVTIARIVEQALRERGFENVDQLAPGANDDRIGMGPMEKARIREKLGTINVGITTFTRRR